MNVLALETDAVQADAIRHVVCNLVGARLTVAASVEHVLQLIRTSVPDLVLLPALVSPSQEATLIEALRSLPDASHVDTLITPMLPPHADTLITAPQGWRRWTRRVQAQTTSAEANLFAESLRWALERVRDRKARRVPVERDEPVILERIVEPVSLSLEVVTSSELSAAPSEADSLRRFLESSDTVEIDLEDPTNRLLKKLNPASASDRRQYRRFAASELPGLRSARIKFGPSVALVDVSSGGALLETDARLPPESEALLELFGNSRQAVIPFRVLRCQVAGLNGAPRYLGACAFKQPLDLDELAWAAADAAALEAHAPALTLVPARIAVRNAW